MSLWRSMPWQCAEQWRTRCDGVGGDVHEEYIRVFDTLDVSRRELMVCAGTASRERRSGF
jgi:hypothetical protein